MADSKANPYHVIVKNIFSNWANVAVMAGIGFFIMPYMVLKLGDALYGIWILLLSVVGYGSLLDLGVTSSIIKYVSQHQSERSERKLDELFNTCLFIYLVVGVSVAVTIWVLSDYLLLLFALTPDQRTIAKVCLRIFGINLGIKFSLGIFPAFVFGIQRFDLTNGINIVVSLIKTAAIVLLLQRGFGIFCLSLLTLGGDLAYYLCVFLVFKRKMPELRLDFRKVRKETTKRIYSFGIYSFLIAIASRTIYESSSIIIGAFLPVQAITFYAIANNLMRYVRQFAFGFGNVFNPAASAIEVGVGKEGLGRLLIFGTKYSLLFVLPVVLGVIILGREFIVIWLGEKYSGVCYKVLVILCIGQLPSMAQFAAGSILYGLARHKILALTLLVEATVVVIASFYLVKRFGIIGIALAVSIPEFLTNSFFMPLYVCRTVQISIASYVREALVPCLTSAAVLAFSLIVMKLIKQPDSWLTLMAEVILGCSAYSVVAFLTSIEQSRKNSIRSGVIKKIRMFCGAST